jgi:hypothetical protein
MNGEQPAAGREPVPTSEGALARAKPQEIAVGAARRETSRSSAHPCHQPASSTRRSRASTAVNRTESRRPRSAAPARGETPLW